MKLWLLARSMNWVMSWRRRSSPIPAPVTIPCSRGRAAAGRSPSSASRARAVSVMPWPDVWQLGEGVVEVPPFLTVRERKHLRQRGKSDPADALAIARVVAREADLPRFLIHDRARQLGQILNYRDQLVEERTRGA